MANANFYLDKMDSCPTHGIDAMRHTPVDGETPRNLDHWDCAECDFNAGSIDWVARRDDSDDASHVAWQAQKADLERHDELFFCEWDRRGES